METLNTVRAHCSACRERQERIAQLRHEMAVLERLVAECADVTAARTDLREKE